MRALTTIAAKEIRDGLRNRWVVAATLLLGALALSLSFLGSAPTGTVGVSALGVTVVSLSSLTMYLVPLIALMLSYDAVVGEIERGTMLLTLAYPVARWQIILGKFAGHISILAFATVLGYGAAAVAISLTGDGDGESWRAFARMIGSSVLLGATFLAIGYLLSAVVSERSTAIGLAVGVWLFFGLLYDMALLGALVADTGQIIDAGLFPYLLLANPADVYRLINLGGLDSAGAFSGMAGLSAQVGFAPGLLVALLVAWTLAPLAAASAIFQRKEL